MFVCAIPLISALFTACAPLPLILVSCAVMSVSRNPGQMALTVTPVVAVSRATALVKPTTPCLAAT